LPSALHPTAEGLFFAPEQTQSYIANGRFDQESATVEFGAPPLKQKINGTLAR
jgi:hypothetical protein